MARSPFGSARDVEARVEAYRDRLVATGLAARMSPTQLTEQVASVREMLLTAGDTTGQVETSETIVKTRFRHVEHVTVTSGPTPLHSFDPIRDTAGLVDVEASVLNARLVREATRPDMSALRVPLRTRLVMAVVRWRMREQLRDLPPSTPMDVATMDAMIDQTVREGFRQVRAREEGGA